MPCECPWCGPACACPWCIAAFYWVWETHVSVRAREARGRPRWPARSRRTVSRVLSRLALQVPGPHSRAASRRARLRAVRLPPRAASVLRAVGVSALSRLRQGGASRRRIRGRAPVPAPARGAGCAGVLPRDARHVRPALGRGWDARSEEHTSELQSHVNLVCRLLLEKKNTRAGRGRSCRPAAPGSPAGRRLACTAW